MNNEREFKNLPEGWKWVRLGGILEYEQPQKYIVLTEDYDDKNGIPVLTAGKTFILGYTNENFGICDNLPVILFDDFTTDSKYINFPFKVKSSATKILRQRNVDINLFYVFNAIQLIKLKPGSEHKRFWISEYTKLPIPLPPLPEQQKIAEILETVDNAIEKTDKIIEKYKRIKQGLMQDLLTKGIDENGNIRDEKTHKFKDSPLGKIPEEWEVVRLGEVSYLKGRIGWHGLTVQEYLEEGEYYLVTGTNFEDGRINWDSCVYVSKARYEMDRYIQLKKDDILVTKDGTIGKLAYIFQLPKPATLGTGVFVLRPICKSYYPNFLYYVLNSFIFDRFMENLKAGSTINHLYQKDFVNLLLPLPPLPEQQRIAEILLQIDQTIEKEEQYKEKLQKIKQGLMEDLLTGKVRVNHLVEEEEK
jgi:type I restriction enzyme S subunit